MSCEVTCAALREATLQEQARSKFGRLVAWCCTEGQVQALFAPNPPMSCLFAAKQGEAKMVSFTASFDFSFSAQPSTVFVHVRPSHPGRGATQGLPQSREVRRSSILFVGALRSRRGRRCGMR